MAGAEVVVRRDAQRGIGDGGGAGVGVIAGEGERAGTGLSERAAGTGEVGGEGDRLTAGIDGDGLIGGGAETVGVVDGIAGGEF